jgi:hypothetical protein
MRKSGCRYCLCPEVEPARFRLVDLPLLLLLRRPAKCPHCRERQYVLPFILQWILRPFAGSPSRSLSYRR